MRISLLAVLCLILPGLGFAAVSETTQVTAFSYIKLVVETVTSPQIIILLVVMYLIVKKPKVLERVAMLDIAGVKLQLREIRESVEKTRTDLEKMEQQLELVRADYLKSAEQFDPIASATDIDKLGAYLKSIAASLDNIDFAADYLDLSSSQDQIYAAACAIQVRPQAKFLEPIASYLTAIADKTDLHNIRLRVVYKLVQCVENILRSDNKKLNPVIPYSQRLKVKCALEALAQHPYCQQDELDNNLKSINARIKRGLKLIEIDR